MNPTIWHRLLCRHRAAMALWLALLLPCGQAAATVHLLSHIDRPVVGASGAVDNNHCDDCLAAFAVAAAAAPSRPSVAFPLALADAAPLVQAQAGHALAPRLAYRSRAPPLAPR